MTGVSVAEAKELICEMCRNFYNQGWVSGTGGGISVRTADRIVMAPSGVQKERMQPEDMFVLDQEGNVVETPVARPAPSRPPKLSECSPLFLAAYKLRDAGAVIHSHSMAAMMVSLLDPSATEFRCTNLEMIKGIANHSFYGGCVVPIIENTARECELTERLEAAIKLYPSANAVLVRRHGVYIWGADWIQAKTQAECYHYLFEAAVEMRKLGYDAAQAPRQLIDPDDVIHRAEALEQAKAAPNGHAAKRPRVVVNGDQNGKVPAVRAVVLDIEGTVAPLTFVSQVLFPYARDHCAAHLDAHYDEAECIADVDSLRQLVTEELAAGTTPGVVAIPARTTLNRQAVVDATVKSVQALIAADRKVGPLKTFQGHVWRTGFEAGDLVAQFFDDVAPALVQWSANGLRTYIYSSGSREAQRLAFKHSNAGDVRGHVGGYFDTSIGSKLEASSYREIFLTLGLDHPSEILFATDNVKEAHAAVAAGWRCALVDRPGNHPLPPRDQLPVPVIASMSDLLKSVHRKE